MMSKIPDRLFIDKADRKLYDHDALQSEIFAGKTRKEQFLFAMSIGFKNQVHRPLDTREGWFRTEYMNNEDETMLDMVAVNHTGRVDVLSNREEVFKIAEEYAHAGIRLLHDEVTSGQPGSFSKKLELDLFGIFERLNLD
jgi:hypothetical protein